MYTNPCLKDGGPKKELSKTSTSFLEEGTSFEVPALLPAVLRQECEPGMRPEARMRLDDVAEEEEDEDENYEEPSIVNSNPGSALKESPKWLNALQTRRQQGASVDDQSFTDSDNDDGV